MQVDVILIAHTILASVSGCPFCTYLPFQTDVHCRSIFTSFIFSKELDSQICSVIWRYMVAVPFESVCSHLDFEMNENPLQVIQPTFLITRVKFVLSTR